jgi:hypothetical protein
VFKLSPGNNLWTYTSIHDYTNGMDGAYPAGTVAFDASGNLYGTASSGGDLLYCGAGCGVVWEIISP